MFEQGYDGSKNLKSVIKDLTYINYVGDKKVTLRDAGLDILTTEGDVANIIISTGRDGSNSAGIVIGSPNSKTKEINTSSDTSLGSGISQSKNSSDDDLFGPASVKTESTKKNEVNTISKPLILPIRPGSIRIGDTVLDYFLNLGERGNSTTPTIPGKGNSIPNYPDTGGNISYPEIGGNTNHQNIPGNTENGEYLKTFLGITDNSSKEEIDALGVDDLTLLYKHAMSNHWKNSNIVYEVYNSKISDSTKQTDGNVGPVVSSGTENNEVNQCYLQGLNEVELQECLDARGADGSGGEPQLSKPTIPGIDEHGNKISGMASLDDLLSGTFEDMSDEEISDISNSGFDISEILTGDFGGSTITPKSDYKIEYGKMESDANFKNAVTYDDDMLLLTAYQELSYGVYNEKMEAVNPKQIPVPEPKVKKVTFLNYNNAEVKSQLLLKYVMFFAALFLITIIFIRGSRSVQEEKRKEIFNSMLKFREEEIIFTDYVNDNTLGVD